MKQKLLLLLLMITGVASAQFTGAYNLNNWTLTNNNPNSDASVDLSGAPNSFIFTGSNSGFNIGSGNYDDYQITVPTATTLSFDYQFFTNDFVDSFSYAINGTPTSVTTSGSGNLSIPVSAGDVFAFRVINDDDCCGAGFLTISNFSSGPSCFNPSVPTITSAPGTICDGNSALLTISGSLNDATQWKVYTDSCGGTLVGSTAGSTIIVTPPTGTTTYYVRGEGGCVSPGSCGTVSISTTPREDATFSYSASSYCVNDADPSPTITGVSGGTFSSGGGLSINASTGNIDVSASIPGTYSVSYSTSGLCNGTENVSVTINALDNASFSYSSASYDVADSDPTPTITGLAGGTFSSTAGLSINASTGVLDVSASTPATYTVTYAISGSCPNSSTSSITITNICSLTASITSQTNVACNNDSTGALTVTPTNGLAPYTYLWSNGAITATTTNLPAGNYNVTVTDDNGCTATANGTITEPTVLVASASINANVTCNGGTDGGITVSPSGGTSPYTYLWSNGATTATNNNIAAGNYSVTVTDNNGCTATANGTITEPPVLAGSVSTDANVSCNGGTDGSLTVIPSGGTPPYNYLWSNGAISATTTNLPAGNYNVTITDSNGCTATANGTITEPVALTATISATGVTSIGGTDGTASVIVSGGTLPYTYSWSPSGGTSATATGLSAGTYTCTITDNNACSIMKSVEVEEPISPENLPFVESFDNVSGDNSGAQGTYVFPAGWLLVDVDNKTPHPNLSFVNDAWERMESFGGSLDTVAVSNSWYSPAGQADDWMWTPPISLTGENLQLSWNAMAPDANFRDGYEVRLMTVAPTGSTGNIGNMLTDSDVLFSVAEENSIWTSRNLSLDDYVGQTVYIGFRNNSFDKYLLQIDDVVVENLATGPDANNILYVDNNATGNGLGDSWANALPELADALKYAKEQDNFTTANPLQIWVAGGTYKPLYSPVDNNFGNDATRENSFLMVNNVQVYGGFVGTESTLAARDLSLTANESVLSGDVNGDDDGFTNNAENNLHVVVSSGNVGNARLDGFTITGGNANTIASANINGNSFSRRNGGGIFNFNSSPSFTNLKVKGNSTVDNGGGIVNINSSPTLINVILSGNTANNASGILNQNNSSPSFTNVTVSANTASINGGGILNSVNSSPTLINTIVWGNTVTSGVDGIFNDGSSSANISFSLVQDIDNSDSNGVDGTDTTNAPQFADAANGDFSLTQTSPAINTGSNTAYTNAGGDLQNDSDLAGNPRLYDGLATTDVIDMGALEFQGQPVINYVYENGTWTPQTPFGNSTALDNITIVNGVVDLTEEFTCNNLTVEDGADLNIFDVLNLNGDLSSSLGGASNGVVIFKSLANKNGELAELSPGSEISGPIFTERYVSANRAYRMISSPTTSELDGQPVPISILLQSSGSLPPSPSGLGNDISYGTHITGSTTGANGFDATVTGNPSMFTLDVANQSFTPIANTNATSLEHAKGYLLFVRGDRSIDLTNNDATPTATRLIFAGEMPTGDQVQNFTTNNAGDFVMFGNPYQSAVDMSEVVANSTNVNTSQFYVYDPTLGDNGAYVTVPFTGSPIPAGSDADIYLQPGQGAQIANVSAGNVSVLFQESNKAPGNHNSTFRNAANLEASISASLYTTENYSAGKKPHDGFALNFSDDYTNEVTMNDAPKPFNFFENVGIVSNNNTFSIEQREIPVEGEEILLYSSGYRHNNYTFVLNLENLDGLTAIFRDAYTNTEIVLENGENVLNFSVEEDIQASMAEDRFSLNFGENNLGLKQDSVFGLSLYPNPVSGEYLTIRSGKLAGKTVNLMVSDMLGRTVMLQETTFSGSELKVNLGEKLTSGTYFMTIENNDKKETLRFIKR